MTTVMANVFKKLVDAAHRFTAYDFTIFKLTLLSAGILLGAYFSRFFLENITIVWIVGLLCWVVLMWRLLGKYRS